MSLMDTRERYLLNGLSNLEKKTSQCDSITKKPCKPPAIQFRSSGGAQCSTMGAMVPKVWHVTSEATDWL